MSTQEERLRASMQNADTVQRLTYDTPMRGANHPGEVSDDLLRRVIEYVRYNWSDYNADPELSDSKQDALIEELERVQAAR